MSTKTTETFVEEGGIKKDALEVIFTNGSLQQLKDLASFLKVQNPSDVVEKAIGIVQQLKDIQEKQEPKIPLEI